MTLAFSVSALKSVQNVDIPKTKYNSIGPDILTWASADVDLFCFDGLNWSHLVRISRWETLSECGGGTGRGRHGHMFAFPPVCLTPDLPHRSAVKYFAALVSPFWFLRSSNISVFQHPPLTPTSQCLRFLRYST